MSKSVLPTPEQALPGRSNEMQISNQHYVTGQPLKPPFADGLVTAVFGMGCFWGAERRFWQQPGVVTTAVGYAGGYTPNATYEEACSGLTGHAEVVLVVFDPLQTSFEKLLAVFWEAHDPTQGMRQGNDMGSQYRSAIFTTTAAQLTAAKDSKGMFQASLKNGGYGPITTQIAPLEAGYFAEDYHQQYLAKNPGGYCGIAGTGVSCPIGLNA